MIELRAEMFTGLDRVTVTIADLRRALQQAIELEHATIPPYLYALYSLSPGANAEIAELIGSVVIEEMAHMATAANLLNAVGGTPMIDAPGFMPAYPGTLPGAVDGGLVVGLRPFSREVVRDVFMAIEQPEPAAPDALTVGAFYAAIQTGIRSLGEAIFTGAPERQVLGPLRSFAIPRITDVASAVRAIDLIVEQGEGTADRPLDEEGDLAHYFRFGEIVAGRRYVPDRTGEKPSWSYTGQRIAFSARGVRPARCDPRFDDYPVGTPARRACTTFNYTYTSLLRVLHAAVNGRPGALRSAIPLMESLKVQAIAMMAISAGDGTTAGPSFEYQPINA